MHRQTPDQFYYLDRVADAGGNKRIRAQASQVTLSVHTQVSMSSLSCIICILVLPVFELEGQDRLIWHQLCNESIQQQNHQFKQSLYGIICRLISINSFVTALEVKSPKGIGHLLTHPL